MEIEFDPEKARANPIIHEGVTFEEARPVLLGPYALTREDTDAESEQQFVSLPTTEGTGGHPLGFGGHPLGFTWF